MLGHDGRTARSNSSPVMLGALELPTASPVSVEALGVAFARLDDAFRERPVRLARLQSSLPIPSDSLAAGA